MVISQVCSVEKARLGEKIGSLSEARVEEILDGLRFQQRSFFGRRRILADGLAGTAEEGVP